MALRLVIKRDGSREQFLPTKITIAILKALEPTKTGTLMDAEKVSQRVVAILEKKFQRKPPNIEEIQDIIIKELEAAGYRKASHAYTVYRQRKAEEREIKEKFGVSDFLKLGANALNVLCKRYLFRDEKGKIIETPAQLFMRVAKAIAAVDSKYGGDTNKAEEEFYNIMASREFMPGSPAFNAGTGAGSLSSCFVLPVEDSLKSIFKTLGDMGTIHQSGGGTGFDFSHLRPKGGFIKTTQGVSSGPISFMEIYDSATNTMKAGSKRRGANMGIMRFDHPDVLDFIVVKRDETKLQNFNISVSVTDDFMNKAEKRENYWLVNPKTKEKVKELNAGKVLDLICESAWMTGDPGLIFLDTINKNNPTAHLGPIEATNPCSELPLHPYESCNLGSINLGKFVFADGKPDIDWERLKKTIWIGVHFLDNLIDANKYPIPEIDKMTKANRRIGLGVMGWADMLFFLGIPYNSEEALKLAEKVIGFIQEEGQKASIELGKKRGSFPNFKGSLWEKKGFPAMRNATVTMVAPTGTISIIAGCSSGIEPAFAICFIRNVLEGTQLLETNWVFEKTAEEKDFYSKELMERVAKSGSVQGIKEIPEDVRKVFITALEIPPEWHIKMQAAFQKYCDSGISKTVNLPHEATPADIKKIYFLAWKMKCKTICIYRYGSKSQQVLYIGEVKMRKPMKKAVIVESEFSPDCPSGTCPT